MKNSNIQWIGDIPDNWEIVKGKHCFRLVQRPTKQDDEVITCFRDGMVTLRKNRREEGFTISTKEFGYQGIEVGDLIVHGMDGFAGAIGISDSRGKASPVLNVLDTIGNKKYYMYLLRSMAYNGVFEALSTGIRVRTCDTNWGKLKDLVYCVPPLATQTTIATYLDAKCSEIDGLIADINKQIETLNELKKSTITEAVTKGLNKNAKLKDSGIQWIGMIPEGWKVTKLKYVATVKSNLVHPKDYLDFPQVAPDNIEKNSGKLLGYNSVLESGVISDNHLFYKGQIIYSKIRPTLNKVTIAPFDGLCSADMYPIETNFNVIFVKYLMLSDIFVLQVGVVVQDRVKMPKINQEELNEIRVVIPPLTEQQSIAAYLDSKCSEFDSIISDKQNQISTLETYKKSLIYEYVTGKKEVE